MLEVLGQATQPFGPSWEWIITAICLPLIAACGGAIFWRLWRGESKFETLTIETTRLGEGLKMQGESNRDLAVAIGKLVDRMADSNVENAGAVGEMQAAIAKEYVRRAEFDRYQDLVNERFNEVAAIREIHAAVKRIVRETA